MAASHLQSTTISFATPNGGKIREARISPPQLQLQKFPEPFFNGLYCRTRNARLITACALPTSTGTESASSVSESVNSLDSVRVFDLNGNEIILSDLWKDRKAVVAFARHFGCVLCRKRADYLASQKDKMDAAGVALILIGPGSVAQANTFAEQTKFKGEPGYTEMEGLRSKGVADEPANVGGKNQSKFNEVIQQLRDETKGEMTEMKSEITEMKNQMSAMLTLLQNLSRNNEKGKEKEAGVTSEDKTSPLLPTPPSSSQTKVQQPQAGLKIIQAYMEGYRQDWELSFEKDTRTKGGWQQGGVIVAGPGKLNISYIHKDKEAGDDPDIQEILKACCE